MAPVWGTGAVSAPSSLINKENEMTHTIQDWVDRFGIEAHHHFRGVVKEGDEFAAEGDPVGAFIYAVTLVTTRNEDGSHRVMFVPHFQQSVKVSEASGDPAAAHASVAELLDMLRSDALGYATTHGFEGWADEYHSGQTKTMAEWAKVRATYDAIVADAEQLRLLVGEENWDAFLWDTEGD